MSGYCKRGHRKPKRKPYGQQRGLYWCRGCDADLVPSTHKPMKKRERRLAKEIIRYFLYKSYS